MARYNGHWFIQITDINGDVATVRIPWNAPDTTTLATLATDMATLEAAVAALTNGKVTRQGVNALFNEAQYLVGTAPPTNAEYSSVTDGAKLQFATGDGQRTSVTIPAVIEAAFGSDSNVVDSTQAAVATFITAFEANAVPPSGSGTYNLYKGGIKVGKRARKRRTALIP